MHGDFEAQRHWMEVTIHLPATHWYFHDLEWWGLDYPPLTAYHSWLLGKIGSSINPAWFALHASRALDDPMLKVYMRATALASEYLVYVPAVVIFVRRFSLRSRLTSWDATIALVAILMQPGLILIDHAHFQYNSVMLGLLVASAAGMISGNFFWASAFFVASLGFKQMALYYAPAVFAYLLGSCFTPRLNVGRFLGIAVVTAISFAALFLPLVLGAVHDWYAGFDTEQLRAPPLLDLLPRVQQAPLSSIALQLAQCIHRIFPFARGLFEDKVANFWCAAHTFHKLHRYPVQLLQRLSLGATLISILPPCLLMGMYPQPQVLLYGLAASAWGFFLFSFQVHEKSVLVPLLPMTLLLAGDRGLQPWIRGWITWANVLGSWTMYPLLKRDVLTVPYFVLTLLWAWLMGVPSLVFSRTHDGSDAWSKLVHGSFYLAMTAWHLLEACVKPPAGKPDTWVVVNVLVGAAGFGLCYLWCLWGCYQAATTPSSSRRTIASKKTH